MKKLISSLILAAFACSSAYAASSTVTLATGTSTDVLVDDCLILSTGVKVGLSQNVAGSVFCREADGTNVSMIMVGTCHTAGLSKTRDVKCVNKGTDLAPIFYPEGCTSADGVVTISVNGPSLFFADTATGGSMVETALGNVCSSENVQIFVDAEADALSAI